MQAVSSMPHVLMPYASLHRCTPAAPRCILQANKLFEIRLTHSAGATACAPSRHFSHSKKKKRRLEWNKGLTGRHHDQQGLLQAPAWRRQGHPVKGHGQQPHHRSLQECTCRDDVQVRLALNPLCDSVELIARPRPLHAPQLPLRALGPQLRGNDVLAVCRGGGGR